ncbi:MAG: response regulator, partial [Lachnospiraceae bacterium]|nr:response regulator [Lachnospiraceae bacterium]
MSHKGIKYRLYDNGADIKQRLFVLNILTMQIVLVVTLIEILITDKFSLDAMLLFAMMLSILFAGIVSVKSGHIRLGALFIATILSFGYFPVTFFKGGGINGDAPLWFIYNIFFVGILLSGKVKYLFLSAQVLSAVACYVTGYLKPEWIVPNTDLMAHVYSLTALILISIAISSMIGLEIRLFIRENKLSEERKKEIEALNASQNRFFSSMSHEIRTPINTIIGLNEMILREDISDEVAEDAVNIRSAGTMLLNLINDILDMSKVQSGKMVIAEEPYSIGNMLSEIVGMLWNRANEKKLEFHVNVAPDIPYELIGDEIRIKQILLNVLNNSIKYTKEGSVSLSVQCERKDDNNAVIIFTVKDTGIGIKKEDIPYLFTAFKRVDENETRHIEGTGLGLSIVKQFLDLMGGKVNVNSIYTQGSTFIIEIPQKINGDKLIGDVDFEKSRTIAKLKEYHQKFEAPDARVLVVDDNELNLMVTSKLLRGTKVKIDCVSSGEEALKKTLNVPYNVILLDHLMPEMDGIECIRKIRSQIGGLCRECSIVALTANTGEENKALYVKEGFDGYLLKPVTGETLENEVLRHIPQELVHVIGDSQEILEETISWMRSKQIKKKVIVTTESVADIPDELIEKYNIPILPHKVSTPEGLFKDGSEIDTRGVLSYMEDKEHTIKPQAPNVKEHEDFFASQLNRANNLVHMSISSKVENSGCPKAIEAARAFNNVTVIDTGHLSSGQGLMVVEACKLA